MPTPESRLNYLYRQYVEKKCTLEELQEFFTCVRDPAQHELVSRIMQEHQDAIGVPKDLPAVDWAFMYRKITASGSGEQGQTLPVPALKGKLISPRFTRVAAAAVILLLAGTGYLFFSRQRHSATPEMTSITGIRPGYDKATLTVSGGQTIILDSTHTGQLLQQGGSLVINSKNGQLAYQDDSHDRSGSQIPAVFHTLSTPRGGQYQLTLPDGTKVWLNAASSLRYPTSFSAKERLVEMTGEAYFEVAHDSRRPFRVRSEGQTIEDIGTSFNVNAYADEPVQVTTLLEGLVRIGGHLLHPGEKASAMPSGNIEVSAGTPEQAVAWKNGMFDFSNSDLKAVMRQLSRWYNVDVLYEGNVMQRHFYGMIGRSLTLDQMLSGLKREGIHYRFEDGHKLIIIP